MAHFFGLYKPWLSRAVLQPSASNMALRPLSMFPYRGMMLPAMLPLNLFPGAVGSAIRAAQHSSRPGYQRGSA